MNVSIWAAASRNGLTGPAKSVGRQAGCIVNSDLEAISG